METDTTSSKVTSWLRGRLPEAWTAGDLAVTVDREEITVVLPLPGGTDAPDGATHDEDEIEGRISRFRSESRAERMTIADEAERRYGRKVAWGVSAGGRTELFTTLAVPVMTRLRQPERAVLDTLVDAGVARSRSDALAWCVRLVGEHTESWLGELREAMAEVDKLRASGPDL